MPSVLLDIILVLFISSGVRLSHGSHSSVQLIAPNQYKGIVISLPPDLNNAQQNAILAKTQDLISNASKELYEASRHRAYFKEVTIVVPRSWNSSLSQEPNLKPYIKNNAKYRDADIIIKSDSEISSDSFTLQYAGCGQHSLPIVISKKLVSANGDNDVDGGKLLIHEWAHYRYGVFNEFGFPDDSMYPLYYSVPGKSSNDDNAVPYITSCTDKDQKFNVTAKDKYNYPCEMKTNNESGLPILTNCIPLPDINNNTIKSSLMYQQSIKSVSNFCDSQDNKHNVNSPNKQNVLCDGKDTWSVVLSHPDFLKSAANGVSPPPTTFYYSIDPIPTVLIAMINSDFMNDNSRSDWINQVLGKFTKLDLESYSRVKLFTFNGDSIYNSDDEWQDAATITTYTQFRGTKKPTDIENVLNEGLNSFKKIVSSGTFVIVIGGPDIKNSTNKLDNILADLKLLNIKIKFILYPSFDSYNSINILKRIIEVTDGSILFVQEYSKDTNDYRVNTLHELIEAFESVVDDYSGGALRQNFLLKTQIFHNPSNGIVFDFMTDETIATQVKVYLVQSNAILDTQNLNLSNSNGYSNNKRNYIYPNNSPPFILGFNNIPVNGATLWTLSGVIFAGKGNGDSIMAVAKFQSPNQLNVRSDEQPITAKCWLSSDTGVVDLSNQYLKVYVQINRGLEILVNNLNVTVYITDNDGLFVGHFDLIDDGFGDPDITKNDGIYSQYIVDIQFEGIYHIKANLSDNENKITLTSHFGSTSLPTKHANNFCCGSKVEGQTFSSNIRNLIRQLDCGSIYVKNNPSNIYPPNSVRDLKIENVDISSRSVKLSWSASGGHYTFDTASKYEIKAFLGQEYDLNLRNQIKANFESMRGIDIEYAPIKPENYGTTQTSLIKILAKNGGMVYLALKSYNVKTSSAVSNIVVAYIGNVEIASTTALPPNDVSSETAGSSEKDTLRIGGIDWWIFVIIIIGVLILLILLICCVIFAFFKKRRKQNEEQKIAPPPTLASNIPQRISPPLSKDSSISVDNNSLTHSIDKIPDANSFMPKTNNTNNSYNSGSQASIRELNANTLSPVQSWDAKDLLSHWGRVQEAKQKRETPPVMRIEDIEAASTASHRSLSYASSEEENTANYSRPNTWKYQDINYARPVYIPSSYPEPAFRTSLDPLRSNTPSDSVPRYSTVNRRPTATVSQV